MMFVEHMISRIDTWSLGVVLYIMLSRRTPFTHIVEGDFEPMYHEIVSGHINSMYDSNWFGVSEE